MSRRTCLLLAAGALAGAPVLAQETAGAAGEPFEIQNDPLAVQALGLRCHTPVFERAEPETASDCAYNSTTIQSQYDPLYVFDIPVVFHVIQNAGGTGNITDAKVISQIEVLNEDFRALAGSNGAGGFDTMIQFHLATVDPLGNPTNGITRSTNTTWYNDGGAYYNTLAWDPDHYLNIYSNSAAGALGYVPDLPQGGGIVGSNADRVVVYWGSVGKNAPAFPYHQGRTVTHEVGHYLGLFHTFDFGCGTGSQPGCYTSGDRICDTNSEANPRFGCPGSATSCGTADPFHNYMDYTDDLCMTGFTEEQSNRMRCTLLYWRSDLYSAACGGLASSASRNAGTNPLSLSANPPQIGGTLTLQVDLSTSGHSQALAIGYLGTLDIPLATGQWLLVNVADPAGELLGLSAMPGPLATWNLPISASVCGFPLSIQAIHFGGVLPFALSNARDLVIGL